VNEIAAVVLAIALVFERAPQAGSQVSAGPETVAVTNGSLKLRGLLWRPAGSGPFAAVLFNHGSYGETDPLPMAEPFALGPLCARHGYLFLFLFRQGVGLSNGQGTADDRRRRAQPHLPQCLHLGARRVPLPR
jgi:hypothetical protein